MESSEFPLISVVTVTYNAETVLEETILSVVNQTYSNIEYIIIDGGSTDRTLDIVKDYQDKVTHWISEPDKGIYDAMNKATRIASGDWLIFMNAGDVFFEKNILEKCILKMTNFDALYYGDVYMSEIRKLYWGRFSKFKLAVGNICHQGIFYPRIIYTCNEYDLTYKVYADYYYNVSIYRSCQFIFLNETIAKYDFCGFSSFSRDEPFEKIIGHTILVNLGFFAYITRKLYWSLIRIKRLILRNK
ncbi:glycosyltransferase [Dysgonomonas capnocytophagoides]|uniref:Glycosyltransferase n=1 Tax=Dysgonomonas capnocytophagoides TaxID=45254 RepID=A0A4Y8KV48_9BACT|nr:glycosyltransferase family 2 protein [Dysgonomonas capnocytophagoides]TFD93178.1 glycosyltransferase [Dysgonomonas capnocytophagoides]